MIELRDVFPPHVVADFMNGLQGYDDIWPAYFSLQYEIAQAHGNYASDLRKWGEPSYRTCDICGHIHDTDEYGICRGLCANSACRIARAFWRYTDSLYRPPRALGAWNRKNDDSARVIARNGWFKKRMSELFGTTVIFNLPADIRLDTLLALSVERIAIEQQPTASTADDIDCTEVAVDRQKNGTRNRCSGATTGAAAAY